MNLTPPTFGLVIIGRNEGARLQACLTSVCATGAPIVYVDSGSTDQSVGHARASGASVVELDLDRPFTAARARNEGLSRLLSLEPALRYVQFIDGDCTLDAGWISSAIRFLENSANYAVACGRRRERFPDASIYNRLCDMEWNTPIGDARACGGDAMMRISALQQIGGFDASLIAGEEPELCVRLRHAGWRIRRLDCEMTSHDAAMMHFSQWWRRNIRGGYAFALGASLHGAAPERHWVRETRSIVAWAMVLPMLSMTLAWPTGGASLLTWLAYPLLMVKIAIGNKRQTATLRQRSLLGFFTVIGKYPQALGVLRCWADRVTRGGGGLIEYKSRVAQAARA